MDENLSDSRGTNMHGPSVTEAGDKEVGTGQEGGRGRLAVLPSPPVFCSGHPGVVYVFSIFNFI